MVQGIANHHNKLAPMNCGELDTWQWYRRIKCKSQKKLSMGEESRQGGLKEIKGILINDLA